MSARAGTDGLPELPGAAARRRRRPAAAAPDAAGRRRRPAASAVLILFGEGPGGPDVLLIEKSAHLRRHAGQPAFPGGGVDPGDDYPVGTALREAAGGGRRSTRTASACWPPCPSCSSAPSDNLVVPVVAWWDDPRDVTVGDPRRGGPGGPGAAGRARRPGATASACGTRRATSGPAFDVADMVVWGFTAGLLDAILEAAGLARPWDTDDVRPLPDAAVPGRRLPGTVDGEDDEDAAAPTVADPAPDGPPTRTVVPR